MMRDVCRGVAAFRIEQPFVEGIAQAGGYRCDVIDARLEPVFGESGRNGAKAIRSHCGIAIRSLQAYYDAPELPVQQQMAADEASFRIDREALAGFRIVILDEGKSPMRAALAESAMDASVKA